MNLKRSIRLMAVVACLAPTVAAAAATQLLTGTIRDFNSYNAGAGHPDFENYCCGDDLGIAANSLVGGKPVYAGGSHWTITSASSFAQWYQDTPGVNVSHDITLTLTETSPGSGLFQYSNSAFFPLDAGGTPDADAGGFTGFNQITDGHNFGFTTEFNTAFTYQAARNDSFAFSGDDDVFVFINGLLALDLGGVHAAESASINLNALAGTLGLADGGNYSLDVFQAERHTVASNFTMTTTLLLQPQNEAPEPATLALLALGVAGIAASRRRRPA